MYDGARVTLKEAELLLLNYSIRQNITDLGIDESLLEDNEPLRILLLCNSCNENHDKKVLHSTNSYFLQIPLKPQMEDFVNSDKYSLISQQVNDDDLSNIMSG